MKGKGDFALSHHSARAFLNICIPILESYSEDNPEEAAKQAGEEFGNIISVATNLNLALELALKSLLIAEYGKAPQEHNLLKLFNKAPTKVKNILQACYLHNMKKLDFKAMAFHLKVGEGLDKPTHDLTKNPNEKIEDVLSRSPNGFVLWRYFHEVPKEPVLIEHKKLYIITRCILHHVRVNFDLYDKKREERESAKP